MSKKSMVVWGRKLQLDIVFDCYEEEEVLESQKEALSLLLDSWDEVDSSLEQVKGQCLADSDGGLKKTDIENIFRFVMPKSLYVTRSKRSRTVALLCDYKLNEDDGLAIVFRNEKLSKIGPQDIVL